MSQKSTTVLPRVGLIYLGIGASLALLWNGWHADAQTLITVAAWPVVAALHLAVGLIYTAVTLVAILAGFILAAVGYWEITQRRFERRMGLKRQGDTMIYVGQK